MPTPRWTHDYDAWRAMRDMEEQDARVPLALALSREALRLCEAAASRGLRALDHAVEDISRELLHRADVGKDLTREEAAQTHAALNYARTLL